jgi:cobalamin synthase
MPQTQSTTPSKDALQRILDGLQTLVRDHLALARAEAKEDLRSMGKDLALGAAGVPALAAGYLLLMMAVAYLLAQWLPAWAAFAIVAVVNLAVGAALTVVCRNKFVRKRLQLRSGTGEELQRNKEWLASLPEATRPQPDGKLPPAHP